MVVDFTAGILRMHHAFTALYGCAQAEMRGHKGARLRLHVRHQNEMLPARYEI